MSKTIFLDTLFVVAAVSPRDQYHERARELVLACAGSRFIVTDAVLLEIGNALEETLAGKLSQLRQDRALQTRQAVLGGAEELRDAVAAGSGAAKRQLADRLPGMAEEPFDVCRDLVGCREAPLSMHVEDDLLTDAAFLALARPWLKLQEARGKAVKLTVDPGIGVRLELEDMPKQPVVTFTASPAPTGGFDVAVEDGPEAARAYSAARAVVLGAQK